MCMCGSEHVFCPMPWSNIRTLPQRPLLPPRFVLHRMRRRTLRSRAERSADLLHGLRGEPQVGAYRLDLLGEVAPKKRATAPPKGNSGP